MSLEEFEQLVVRQFNAPKLIKSVEKRPQIWNQAHVDYKNKTERCNAWEEVAVEMIDEWPTLNKFKRNAGLKQLQKKWKHIKDMFVKDSKNQNKRIYVYSELLQFLRANKTKTRYIFGDDFIAPHKSEEEEDPIETISVGEINIKSENTDDKEEDSDDPYSDKSSRGDRKRFLTFFDEQENATSIQVINTKNDPSTATGTSKKRPLANFSAIRDDDGETDDPDKMFLLSMVPMFKKLDDEKKMLARIQLTQVLQRLLYPKK